MFVKEFPPRRIEPVIRFLLPLIRVTSGLRQSSNFMQSYTITTRQGVSNVWPKNHSFQDVGFRSQSGCQLVDHRGPDRVVACAWSLSEPGTRITRGFVLVDGYSRRAGALWLASGSLVLALPRCQAQWPSDEVVHSVCLRRRG